MNTPPDAAVRLIVASACCALYLALFRFGALGPSERAEFVSVVTRREGRPLEESA